MSSSIKLNRRLVDISELRDRRTTLSGADGLGSVFAGGGQMGELMRKLDWANTPLGPVSAWSPALRMMARFLLANRFPLLLWWGPQFCQLYNDAYRPILGNKHPQFVGRPVSECWNEIWHILEPLIRTPFEGGPSTWMEDIPLELNRHGFLEETHFTIAYSPVPDDTVPSGIGGVLATVHEISEQVVGERRTRALRDLGAGILEERTAEEACVRAAGVLAHYPKDIAFALLYILDAERKVARLAATAGVDAEDVDIAPASIEIVRPDANWPLSRVFAADRLELVKDLRKRFRAVPAGAWSDPVETAAVLPIRSNVSHQLAGFLVAGLSPRLRFDDLYQSFLELTASQIATAVANARAYEEERKRAEMLARLDRAKTAFFSNVSHEFRTPLTLMLGPLEEALSDATLPASQRQRLDSAHRNSLRLLKLVNTLLDFSRIEAGRAQAAYQLTDATTFTAEIASVFRSAIEKAGLKFRVDCEAIQQPVYLDREMWEKVVLNLLSNAFKFTFDGEIAVQLKDRGARFELSVSDTGTGIPSEELPRVFERFHRIEKTRSRTYEGTGIGLALVQELVKLHGGTVEVKSELGRGTTFLVVVPTGKAHLPPDRIEAKRAVASTALDSNSYLQEALRWLPESSEPGTLVGVRSPAPQSSPSGDLIVVADDNADMREYVARLLAPHYRVHAVADGKQALKAIRLLRPSMVLSDVMMPLLDGFGVLRELRRDPELASTPVILLSARAGEESQVEGLQAGADDYLPKPFTARELLARVETHLRMARLRDQAADRERQLRAEAELERERLQELLAQAPAAIGLMTGPEHRWVYVNERYVKVTGRSGPEDFVGRTIRESLPEIDSQPYVDLLDQVYRTGKPYVGREMRATLNRAPGGQPDEVYFDFVYQPVRRADGSTQGILVHAVEVTDKVTARKVIERNAQRLHLAQTAAQIGTWEWDPVKQVSVLSPELHRMFGTDPMDSRHSEKWQNRVHKDDWGRVSDLLLAATHSGSMDFEYRYHHPELGMRWFYCKGARFHDDTRMFGIVQDVTESRLAERALRESEERLRKTEKLAAAGQLAASLAHEINNPLTSVTNSLYLLEKRANLDPQARSVVEIGRSELGRMARIVKQSLSYYRGTLAPKEVDVMEILDESLQVFGPKLQRQGIRVETRVEGCAPVMGFADEIRQVIDNLLVNAAEAMPKGGRLTLSLHPSLDWRNLRARGIRLAVADSGVGIRKELLPKVFEAFFTTKLDKGTGLGLWVVRGLVAKHDGSIRLRTSIRPGRTGTVVSVFLPLAMPS
ncbi:MAG TPA: ATP-binding protein [Terriglobales bacterium]